MPKFNKFSGLFEPEKVTCTSISDENIAKFREAALRFDRIVNKDNEEDIAMNLCLLALRYHGGHECKIEQDLDYPNALEQLQNVYNDHDADMTILAMESMAKENGYEDYMDDEELGFELTMEKKFITLKSMDFIKQKIGELYQENREDITNRLDSVIGTAMLTKESDEALKNHTIKQVKRGQIYWCDFFSGIGREQEGSRTVIIVSNDVHNKFAPTVNVVLMEGRDDKKTYHPKLTEKDFEGGQLKCKVTTALTTCIYTVDKVRLKDYVGILNTDGLGKIEEAIKSQLQL